MQPTSEQIRSLQNNDVNLRLQAAARKRYFYTSVLAAVGWGLSFVFAFAGILGAVFLPSSGALLAAGASFWLFVDQLAIAPLANRQRYLGARLQQRYDARVLGVRVGLQFDGSSDLDADVSALTARADLSKYHDWYNVPQSLQWPHNVLLAQLINAGWGARQHGIYAASQLVLLVAIVTGGTATALALNMSLSAFLIGLALPALPLLLQLAQNVRANIAVSVARRHLANQIRRLADVTSPRIESVDGFQDRLFAIRSEMPHVPGWFYRILRASFERDAAFSANVFTEEVHRSTAF